MLGKVRSLVPRFALYPLSKDIATKRQIRLSYVKRLLLSARSASFASMPFSVSATRGKHGILIVPPCAKDI